MLFGFRRGTRIGGSGFAGSFFGSQIVTKKQNRNCEKYGTHHCTGIRYIENRPGTNIDKITHIVQTEAVDQVTHCAA